MTLKCRAMVSFASIRILRGNLDLHSILQPFVLKYSFCGHHAHFCLDWNKVLLM